MAETIDTIDTPATTATGTTTAAVATDWRAGLTGEHAALAQEKSLDGFKGKDWAEVGPSLAKAFVETKKLVGAKVPTLVVPGDGATPEQVAAYRKATGVPETAADYRITMPELPPGTEWDEPARTAFLTRMHQVGAPPAVVQAMTSWYGAYLTEQHNGYRREAEATEQALRRDWGPNYDANLGRANRAIQQYGGDALVDLFAQNGMARHPLVVRTFAGIGTDLVEHGAMAGDAVGRVTPEEAQDRLTTLRAELVKAPYGSDAHKAVIEQIVQYTKIAQGGR